MARAWAVLVAVALASAAPASAQTQAGAEAGAETETETEAEAETETETEAEAEAETEAETETETEAETEAEAETETETETETEAETGTSVFDRASQALLDGDPHRAAELFERAATSTGEARAADALFSAAELHQARLGQPRRALALYRELLERFPDARSAAAAQLRADDLQLEIAAEPGDQALVAELDAAIARAARGRANRDPRDAGEAARAIEALVNRHPDWPGAARALDWLGAHYRAKGQLDEARDAYRALGARFAESPRAAPARAAALAVDRQLELERQLGWLDAAGLAAALLGLAALLGWIRVAAGSWRAAGRRLIPIPGEVLFGAPVAAALSLAAWAASRDIGGAAAWTCAAGVLATWLLAASAERAALGTLFLRLVAAIALVAGTAFAAVRRTGVFDLILDSAATR